MNIYILPVDKKLRPEHQSWKYPRHNEKFGVEQDFLRYLLKSPNLVSNSPENADWHYLGIYWTRWHLDHGQAKEGWGLEELQQGVNAAILDDKKTFTICQYDDGPMVNLRNTIQFLASRKTESGLDIPLLSSEHRLPFFKPRKKYLASFMGRLGTYPIREDMFDALRGRKDIFIFSRHKSPRSFVRKILQSYIALAPRGYGGSSFRFFEAMQLGVVPFLIGDLDTRPFKEYLPYEELSFYTANPGEINSFLDLKSKEELLTMGEKCQKIYKEKLAYQRWCELVIKTLSSIM